MSRFSSSVLPSALLLLGLCLCSQHAQAAATVEAVETPAWVQTAAGREPARPGRRLAAGDRLQAGVGGRIHLRLDEGSLVQLGEQSEFHIREAEPQAQGGVFRGFLDVLKGAFRFTTTALSASRRRDLSIRVVGITAGIRGTDLWGKAASDRDIVCLIEGDISVRRGNEAPFRMADPLSFYIVPKNQEPKPVGPVNPDQLQRWATETDVDSSRGVLASTGPWQVNLAAYRDRAGALAAAGTLREQGYPVALQEARVGSDTWVRVTLPGFTTVAGARHAGALLQERTGRTGSWISRTP